MSIENSLKAIGLRENEAKVYLTLLERGNMTGYELARLLDMKRPTVYYMLDELRKQELVFKIPHAKKQLFSAKDPRDISKSAHRKAQEIDAVVPKLLALANVSTRPGIQYYEGIEGFEHALNEREKYAKDKELVAFYMYKDDIDERQIEIAEKHLETLHTIGTTVRGLTPDHRRTRATAEQLKKRFGHDIRTIPRDVYHIESSMETVGSSTLILSRDNGQSILIDNDEIADMVRQIFNLVWNSTEFITSKNYFDSTQ